MGTVLGTCVPSKGPDIVANRAWRTGRRRGEHSGSRSGGPALSREPRNLVHTADSQNPRLCPGRQEFRLKLWQ